MFTENLAAFIDTDDFAVAGTIGSTTVNGIFDKPTADALEFAAGRRLTFMCIGSDLPAITLGTTTLVIAATTYTIVENNDDGQGLNTLTLEAA